MFGFAPAFRKGATGCSAVRLAHLLWEQGVVGSNPATPTFSKRNRLQKFAPLFVFIEAHVYFVSIIYLWDLSGVDTDIFVEQFGSV